MPEAWREVLKKENNTEIKGVLFVGIPPVAVIRAIAAFNPAALTWPMVVIISVVIGAIIAIALRLLVGN